MLDTKVPLNRLSFVDVETPNRASNCVCEISIISYENGQHCETITELIDPQAEFQQLNIDIHGIHPEDVAYKDTFDVFFEKYAHLFDADHVLVGHNIRSDINIIQKDLARYDMKLPTKYCIDTQDIVKEYLYPEGIPKGAMALGKVCETLDISLDAHSANSDAQACIAIIDKFKDREGFDLSRYVQDATTSKTKQRREMVAKALQLPPGSKLYHYELGEVKLVSIDENSVVVEKNGFTLSLQYPSCFFKKKLKMEGEEI